MLSFIISLGRSFGMCNFFQRITIIDGIIIMALLLIVDDRALP
jgi:hypothetical protein